MVMSNILKKHRLAEYTELDWAWCQPLKWQTDGADNNAINNTHGHYAPLSVQDSKIFFIS